MRALATISLLLCLTALSAAADVPPANDAAPLPESITVADVLRLLRERGPEVAVQRSLIDVVESEVTEAGLLPNPAVVYQGFSHLAGTNTIDGTQQAVVFEQPLLLAGQRGARREAALGRLNAANASFESFFAQSAREARVRFVGLLASQERRTRLEVARDRLADVERIIRGRAAAGEMSRFDLARISIERSGLDARVAGARTELDAAAVELAALLGSPSWRPRALGSLSPGSITTDASVLWAEAEESLPSLEAARREEAAARRGIDVARRERWPVPVVGVGSFITTEPESYAMIAGFEVPLPVFDRGQAAMQRAAAAARSAQLAVAATTVEARATLERATEILATRRETLIAFERDVMDHLPDLRRMAEDAYRLGQSGVLDLLDVVRSQTDLQLTHVDQLAAVLEAEVDTLFAAGRIEDLSSGGAGAP